MANAMYAALSCARCRCRNACPNGAGRRWGAFNVDPFDTVGSTGHVHLDGRFRWVDEAKVERGKSCLENRTTEIAGNRQQFLTDADEDDALKIRGHERTGRAMGSKPLFYGNLQIFLVSIPK